MAVIFDTTIGGSSANSYVAVAEADDYWATRIYKNTWDAATTTDKQNALIFATRLLDTWVDWKGYITKEDQALRWPRYDVYTRDGWAIDSDVIPDDIKNATSELAGYLLQGDSTGQPDTLGFSRLKVGDLELEIDKLDRDKYGALPDSVIAFVEPYGHIRKRGGSRTIGLVRA